MKHYVVACPAGGEIGPEIMAEVGPEGMTRDSMKKLITELPSARMNTEDYAEVG